MTDAERAALVAEQADLQRIRKKRAPVQGYAGSVAKIDTRLAEIAALLAAEPAPDV